MGSLTPAAALAAKVSKPCPNDSRVATLWTILDLRPSGRGKDWYPKLNY
jgi:hypothetical protein